MEVPLHAVEVPLHAVEELTTKNMHQKIYEKLFSLRAHIGAQQLNPNVVNSVLGTREKVHIFHLKYTLMSIYRAFCVIKYALESRQKVLIVNNNTDCSPILKWYIDLLKSFPIGLANTTFFSIAHSPTSPEKTQTSQIRKGRSLFRQVSASFSVLKNLKTTDLYARSVFIKGYSPCSRGKEQSNITSKPVNVERIFAQPKKNLSLCSLNHTPFPLIYNDFKWVGGTLTNYQEIDKNIYRFLTFSKTIEPLLLEKNVYFLYYYNLKKSFHGLFPLLAVDASKILDNTLQGGDEKTRKLNLASINPLFSKVLIRNLTAPKTRQTPLGTINLVKALFSDSNKVKRDQSVFCAGTHSTVNDESSWAPFSGIQEQPTTLLKRVMFCMEKGAQLKNRIGSVSLSKIYSNINNSHTHKDLQVNRKYLSFPSSFGSLNPSLTPPSVPWSVASMKWGNFQVNSVLSSFTKSNSQQRIQRFTQAITRKNVGLPISEPEWRNIGTVIVLNPEKHQHVIGECVKYKIPIIGFIDSHTDPANVTYPIYGNNDSPLFLSFFMEKLFKLIVKTYIKS